MALILGIETSGDTCSVALFEDTKLLRSLERIEKNVHAAELTTLIEQCLSETQTDIGQLNAVAVSMGPGSYTGLRVGVSSAKGLCYALNIPLIAVGTLEVMTHGFLTQQAAPVVCPMLDARRMEVYAALYNADCETLMPPHAEVLNENSYNNWQNTPVTFFGNGASKMIEFKHKFVNASFIPEFGPKAEYMGAPAFYKWKLKAFENIATFEPFYLKDFFTPAKA